MAGTLCWSGQRWSLIKLFRVEHICLLLSHHSPNTGGSRENLDNETETDSVVSSQRERPRRTDGPEHGEC